jgi:hypothetical protein
VTILCILGVAAGFWLMWNIGKATERRGKK